MTIKKTFSTGKPVNSIIVLQEDVKIVKFDPLTEELLIVNIPGSLYVESAGDYGNYQLRSIYPLSINEKTGKELFRRTIIKNFHIPIHKVVDCRGMNSNKNSLVKTAFSCLNAHNAHDVLTILFSKWKVGGSVSTKDLSDYINIPDSPDAQIKYLKSQNIFSALEFDFSQDMDTNNIVNVKIFVGKNQEPPRYFYDVIKLMGGRVVDVVTEDNNINLDKCEVVGGKTIFVKDVAYVFGCSIKYQKNFDDTNINFSDKYLESF